MDDGIRKSADPTPDGKNAIADNSDEKSDKTTKKRSSISPARSDSSSKKGDRRRSKSKSSERLGRKRRSRSKSRGFSPDRRRRYQGRNYNYRGDSGYYNRRKRSPSDRRSPDRSRAGRNRRSRSKSYDRFKNRRNRSTSRDRGRGWKKGPRSPSPIPAPPPPSNFMGAPQPPLYGDSNTYSGNYAPNTMSGFMPNQPYPNYDYPVPIMQPPPTTFTAYPPPNMQPIPPGDDFQSNAWNMQQVPPPPPIINMQQEPPPPSITVPPQPETSDEGKKRYEAAVEQEMQNQKKTLLNQRDGYKLRAAALRKELKTLKEQRRDLVSGSEPPSPTTNGFLKENDRLQAQIENKISTMVNVIDMLTGIIRDKETASPSSTMKQAPPEARSPSMKKRKKQRSSSKSDDSSPERLKTKVIESLKRNKSVEIFNKEEQEETHQSETAERVNYVYYDPEMHWCKVCSAFPKTAKDYLLHLHSKEHKENDKSDEIPWHTNLEADEMPTYPNAPTKRIPIRGIQFFVPSTSWYCQLCSAWMGDLHCASVHLKSKKHSAEYTKLISKKPNFERDWLSERQKAHERLNPPPPPSVPVTTAAPTTIRFFDGIPLQINQKSKESSTIPVVEPTKKGKKKKKEKKKKKKSKKKRHSSSSSSSTSSSDDSSDEKEKTPEKQPVVDTSQSIRVAMRNSLKNTCAPSNPPAEDDGNDGGKWTVVQEGMPAVPVPLPPTISANGEAEKRKDELIISQWNAPEPIISEKEKLLLEQLKGRLKNREEARSEKKKDVSRPIEKEKEKEKTKEKEKEKDKEREKKDRNQRLSRSKSRSPDRDRDRDRRRIRRSRSYSPVRRGRRSRSYSPKVDRRNRRSRSPRNRRKSRSRSRSRRIEKPVVRQPEFKPRVPEVDNGKGSDKRKSTTKKDDDNKSKTTASKKPTTAMQGKKLPFIGRMPVFKKQVADEDTKKLEQSELQTEEERTFNERKQQEFKFQILQKQQLIQQQQKHAEAYNLAHPGQFQNVYQSVGTIHHVLQPQAEEYDDLMPDPLQYYSIMSGAPPPPPVPVPVAPPATVVNEPVLPPGIDEEEANALEPLSHTPHPHKGPLPKDFQDALSIIFDKGVENDEGGHVSAAPASNAIPAAPPDDEVPNSNQMEMATETSLGDHLAQAMLQHQQHLLQQSTHDIDSSSIPMELDEQSQYIMYGTMSDKPLVFNEISVSQVSAAIVGQSDTNDKLLTQSIPTPPIQILDQDGNLTQIPGQVIEVPNDFLSINAIHLETANTVEDEEKQQKRAQELDDLAMLGIDAEDLAAQCI